MVADGPNYLTNALNTDSKSPRTSLGCKYLNSVVIWVPATEPPYYWVTMFETP